MAPRNNLEELIFDIGTYQVWELYDSFDDEIPAGYYVADSREAVMLNDTWCEVDGDADQALMLAAVQAVELESELRGFELRHPDEWLHQRNA